MKGPAQQLTATTARRIFAWQMLFFAALLSLSALGNSFTVVADRARSGDPLPLIAPLIWEFSSVLLIWLLVPVVSRWLTRFPLSRQIWWRSVPWHLLATVPFSLAHTAGMILLRKLVYWSGGFHYSFGPFWDNWPYEYRKDLMTYWMLIGALLAFRIYGLWLDAREHKSREAVSPEPPRPDSPLDRLVVRKLNREFILDCGDIDRLEADGNYVVVHAAGQNYRMRDSLDGLARRLGEQRFARVHRTHVVNIDRVREIQPWDHGDFRILLKDGTFVNFSRRYRNRLDQRFR